jgi:hypothetical protein
MEQPPAAGTSWSWLTFVIAMLVLAGVAVRAAYRRAAARQRERIELERRLAAASDMFARPPSPSRFAAEVGHWADIARRQPLPRDRFAETEDAVQSLLRATRVARHEHAA